MSEPENTAGIMVDGEGKEGLRYALTLKDEAEIEKRFVYHAPKGDQPNRYSYLRAQVRELAREITLCCPESRERSLALTRLEETVFWANAAIARNE